MLILLGLALCRAAALGDAFHVTIDDEDGEESW